MQQILITILTALTLLVAPGGIFGSTAFAACPPATSSKGQVLNGAGKTGNCNDSGVTNIISAAVNILSIVVGIAAVVVIIYSGFKYITSAGDSGKISAAKNTLIYALVGLIIAALAQLLVHFVLSQANSANASCPKGQHITGTTGACVPN